jgi:hypothetical protein
LRQIHDQIPWKMTMPGEFTKEKTPFLAAALRGSGVVRTIASGQAAR